MPELIRRGHLYIAQPPLYKVSRGKSEQYLLDDAALEDYLYREGQVDGALTLENGEAIAGADLEAVINKARIVRDALVEFPIRLSRDVIVQAALANGLREADDDGAAMAAKIAERLNMISDEFERDWVGSLDGTGGYVFEREVRGVSERRTLTSDLLLSADARRVQSAMADLVPLFDKPAQWVRKEQRMTLFGPEGLLSAVRAAGEAGVKFQRYKGLGEMNPEQLWETTLDVNARVLLQVRVKEADDADDIFSRLMGDVVEPRRAFIQDNALTAELDV